MDSFKEKLSNLRPLATGGQKEVFSAVHSDYGNVVLKIIKKTGDSLERAKREIRAVALINSLNVPKIYEHNCNENSASQIWLLEERIQGSNLRELILKGKHFTLSDVLRFLDTMLTIISVAESKSLIHRDIKPENIILDLSGNFWLIDFGISRHLDLKSITPSNNPYGLFTIGYASSEQFRNLKKDIDSRSDLFSIGIVSYELLNGVNFYIQNTNGDPFKVIKKLETESLPVFKIDGDKSYQLAAFIRLLGDHRRSRRPKDGQSALQIFEAVKITIR